MEHLPSLTLHYFTYKACGDKWRLPLEIHQAYGMVIVLEGEAHYRIDGKVHRVGEGEYLCTRPGMEREGFTSGMVCAAFDFDLVSPSFDPGLVTRFRKTEALTRLLREFQFEWLGRAPGYKLKCSGVFLLILHELQYGGSSGDSYHAERIKRYILEHLSEPIRVESIAASLGLSTVYCGALFRRSQGMTIAHFVNRIRVQKAAAILEEGGSVSETAALCGFNDVYYFSRIFKKFMGVSPSRWSWCCHPPPPLLSRKPYRVAILRPRVKIIYSALNRNPA
ncbi:MAG: AraC family transcriptional regulator [Oscillospiraceae bacterium]|jgi:AraC-like DNA-binding protein|nr:AraC family transcriptional regulator [Oscillospiraceae bacterium]